MFILNLLIVSRTYYLLHAINNIPHGIALRLRRICDSDGKFKHRSEEYKNYYLTARDYHPELVDKQSQKVETTSRYNTRKKNTKRKGVSKSKFITIFNLALEHSLSTFR